MGGGREGVGGYAYAGTGMSEGNGEPTVEASEPTGKTAIMIVPPTDICGFADGYRKLYMPDAMHHVEPHITVAYPFVPFNILEENMPRLRSVLQRCYPRRLSIRGFSTFSEQGVLYLHLADPERVRSLYRAILAEFPEYPAYGGQFGEELTPHLTVGRFATPEKLQEAYEKVAGLRLYFGWDVTWVAVKFQTGDGNWHTWEEPDLGR